MAGPERVRSAVTLLRLAAADMAAAGAEAEIERAAAALARVRAGRGGPRWDVLAALGRPGHRS